MTAALALAACQSAAAPLAPLFLAALVLLAWGAARDVLHDLQPE
jgi:hypothetical protein